MQQERIGSSSDGNVPALWDISGTELETGQEVLFDRELEAFQQWMEHQYCEYPDVHARFDPDTTVTYTDTITEQIGADTFSQICTSTFSYWFERLTKPVDDSLPSNNYPVPPFGQYHEGVGEITIYQDGDTEAISYTSAHVLSELLKAVASRSNGEDYTLEDEASTPIASDIFIYFQNFNIRDQEFDTILLASTLPLLYILEMVYPRLNPLGTPSAIPSEIIGFAQEAQTWSKISYKTFGSIAARLSDAAFATLDQISYIKTWSDMLSRIFGTRQIYQSYTLRVINFNHLIHTPRHIIERALRSALTPQLREVLLETNISIRIPRDVSTFGGLTTWLKLITSSPVIYEEEEDTDSAQPPDVIIGLRVKSVYSSHIKSTTGRVSCEHALRSMKSLPFDDRSEAGPRGAGMTGHDDIGARAMCGHVLYPKGLKLIIRLLKKSSFRPVTRGTADRVTDLGIQWPAFHIEVETHNQPIEIPVPNDPTTMIRLKAGSPIELQIIGPRLVQAAVGLGLERKGLTTPRLLAYINLPRIYLPQGFKNPFPAEIYRQGSRAPTALDLSVMLSNILQPMGANTMFLLGWRFATSQGSLPISTILDLGTTVTLDATQHQTFSLGTETLFLSALDLYHQSTIAAIRQYMVAKYGEHLTVAKVLELHALRDPAAYYNERRLEARLLERIYQELSDQHKIAAARGLRNRSRQGEEIIKILLDLIFQRLLRPERIVHLLRT